MSAINHHLAQHHGVISRAEAIKLGMTASQLEYRLRSGRWERLSPGVYRLTGAPPLWRGNVRAAALSVQGLASHGTAATVHRIDGWDQRRIEVVVSQDRKPSRRRGITIHRSTQMTLADACELHAIPVTGLARTVLDVAAVVGPKRLEWTVDAVLRGGLLEWPDLYAIWARHSAKGRDGCGKLHALLERRYGDKAIPDSKFNRMVGQLLNDAGIDGFLYEHEILKDGRFLARADLAFPQERLAIECDSKTWHLNNHAFEADRTRQNRVTISGWTVLQFTWKTYKESPVSIVNDVYNARALLHQKAN
jgi:very-short-patch-repair endonuclease